MARSGARNLYGQVLLLDPTGRVKSLLEADSARFGWSLNVSDTPVAARMAIQRGLLPAVMLLTVDAGREDEALAALSALKFDPPAHVPRIVALLGENLCLDEAGLLENHDVDACWRLSSLTPSLLDGIVAAELRTFCDAAVQQTQAEPVAEIQSQPVDLNFSIDTALAVILDGLDQGIELVRGYSDIPQVRCNPYLLSQLLTNLIENAIQRQAGAVLRISTTQRDGHAVVTVSDQDTMAGCGPMPDTLRQLDLGQLPAASAVPGWSVVRYIAERHGGHVEVEADGERWVETRVHLPITGAVDSSRITH